MRIVITGIGVVSSIGTGIDAFWDSLIKGRSGITKVTGFDTTEYPTHYGGEIKDLDPKKFLSVEKLQRLGRASYLGVIASGMAIKDAGLDTQLDRKQTGVVIGTTMAETQVFQDLNAAWVKNGQEAIDAQWLPQIPAYALSGNIAREFKLEGPNFVIPCACAAGNYSIGYAFDLLRSGDAKIMLAGGTDAFSRIAFCGFNRLLAVAPEVCQPFDKNRRGMMIGEGAAVLVLEPLESALERKADIYAEVLGYGLSCDAHHMSAPSNQGIAQAIEKSLKEAGIGVDDVDYINAHGTGTPANDREECLALKNVFGDNYKKIAVSSTKSMLGHTMGAASAIEASVCCLAAKFDLIPPAIHYQTPDPDCDIDCVPNASRKQTVNIALNNASAFGGNNACLVLKKYLKTATI